MAGMQKKKKKCCIHSQAGIKGDGYLSSGVKQIKNNCVVWYRH